MTRHEIQILRAVGLAQTAVAAKTKVSVRSVRRIEGEDKTRSSASMEKIARVVLDEKHAQLWINHDKRSSDARRHAPEFYE
jgi:ribosome-binding protein aMBF1 (putative translation factor)